MKNTDEFQLDGLDGIRFAPPWIVRKQWRGGERIHSLALRVGVWRGKKYAPAFVSRAHVSSSPGGVQASGGRFSDALEEYFFSSRAWRHQAVQPLTFA
ncbi:MAG: hypothetical protein KGL65_06735 [Rhodospirillales bacterium]|nr:hypothetical protein [Rhodospirillales bacterium]